MKSVLFTLSKNNKREANLLYFLARLALSSIPLYLVISFVDLSFLQSTVAYQSSIILGISGITSHQEAGMIFIESSRPFLVTISPDSTGWKSLLFLGALIIAVPNIPNRKRLMGLGIGLPIIWIGNLSRVYGIIVAHQLWGEIAAMFVHDWLYRIGLLLLVLVVWFLWWTKSSQKTPNKSNKRHTLNRRRHERC